jgi:hypothetical protein
MPFPSFALPIEPRAEPADGSPLSTPQILLCSGGSKVIASLATYPHEVVRTRLQIARRAADAGAVRPGLVSTVRDVLAREGGRGLYKGFSVNLFRTVPNSAVTMLTCVARDSASPGPALTRGAAQIRAAYALTWLAPRRPPLDACLACLYAGRTNAFRVHIYSPIGTTSPTRLPRV